MSIIRHPELGTIECVRSMRARSIRLVVKSDGTLRLSYPLFTLQSQAIAFAVSKAAWIAKTRSRIAQKTQAYPTITVEERERLRREAHRVIPPMVEHIASRFGLQYNSLRISSARTRWGSCSSKNDISISLYVMLLPEHLRKFIILHELCHTRHHNHSVAFHAMLRILSEGREAKYNAELKHYHIPRVE